ncbi:MAG: S8 family serine peptidase [Silvanigrellales bacterium]|nr:S8 family serine peptidase [Silvanigrellales bacterium]
MPLFFRASFIWLVCLSASKVFAMPSERAYGGGLAAEPKLSALSRFNLDKPHKTNSLIVKFKSAGASALLEAGASVKRSFRSSGASLVNFAPESLRGTSLLSKAQEFEASGLVEWVEANALLSTSALKRHPDDTDFDMLWGLRNQGQAGGLPGIDINVGPAWSSNTGSRSVIVGVIDTGIDALHPELAPNMWRNPGERGLDSQGKPKQSNGVDDDGNGYVDDISGWDFVDDDNSPMDDNGHGTHVAGTIGAKGNNGKGISGVAWNVSLVGLRFLDGSGSGTLADAIEAIEYATNIGVHVTNNSWGGGGYSRAMKAAIDESARKGILFVAAAGNESNDNDEIPSYPASYTSSNVLSVAALSAQGRAAGFSNWGLKSVHLSAPGVGIFSTTPGNTYDTLDGTSMAAPHVTGAAALLKAAFPRLLLAQLRTRLTSNTRVLASLAGKSASGGMLDVARAFEVDEVAPSQVEGVHLDGRGFTDVDVSFFRCGDDASVGSASTYLARLSTRPVLSEEGWGRSKPVELRLLKGNEGQTLKAKIENLPLGFSGFVTFRAVDNVGNVGERSKSLHVETRKLQTVASYNADNPTGVTFQGTWGTELESSQGKVVFSDSPAGLYQNDAESSMNLTFTHVAGQEVYLAFKHTFDLESGYDFGEVQLSTDDGKTYREVVSFTGEQFEWKVHSVRVTPFLQQSGREGKILLRFQLMSDASEVRDGWRVEDVRILGAEPSEE